MDEGTRTVLGILAGPASAILLLVLNEWYKRSAQKKAATAPTRLSPPTWEEFQAFAEEQRLDIVALVNVVRDIADQTTGSHFTINSQSLERLKSKGYLPPAWIPSDDDAA